MSRPKVAVVGSTDASRQFDPPVTDPTGAKAACEDLGRELATAGWNLVVYSSGKSFAESDVVRGYLRSGKAAPGSIEVRAPFGKTAFDEFSTGSSDRADGADGAYSAAFDVHPDPSGDWEVSYYRSLATVDGVLLIGGGRSTLITGLITLARGIPIITAAMFGGNARKVWGHLDNEHHGNGATDDGVDIAAMAAPWGKDSAALLVHSLDSQRAARTRRIQEIEDAGRRQRSRARTGLAAIVALLLLVVAGLAAAWGWRLGAGLSIAALAVLPTLAGAAGALIGSSLDQSRDWTRAAVLGGAAGLITGLLYIASQLIGAPTVLDTSQADTVRRLLFFVLPIGFVAGLTFDAVYTRLRGKDVSQAGTLDAMGVGAQKQS